MFWSCNGKKMKRTSITGITLPPIIIANMFKPGEMSDIESSPWFRPSYVAWIETNMPPELGKIANKGTHCRGSEGWDCVICDQPSHLQGMAERHLEVSFLEMTKLLYWWNFTSTAQFWRMLAWSVLGTVGALRHLTICYLGKRTPPLPGPYFKI